MLWNDKSTAGSCLVSAFDVLVYWCVGVSMVLSPLARRRLHAA